MVVRCSSVSLSGCLSVSLSVCLSVFLSVTNKHENITRTTKPILMKICTHISQKKNMSQKNFGHPRMTLGWSNPEFDFFTIPLSPQKMQKKFQIFFAPSVSRYTGSIFSQKNWISYVPGSSWWHNPKSQGQIYPSMLFSHEPSVGISKNFFLSKSFVKKTILSLNFFYPNPRVPYIHQIEVPF